jgi:hypothetical protein
MRATPSNPQQHYVFLGQHAILELLEEEVVCGWREIEAKLADPAQGNPHIDPHHLTTAKQELIRLGQVEVISGITYGRREVPLLALAGASRSRRFKDKAARKRTILAYYLGWSSTSSGGNVLAEAQERIVNKAMLAAAGVGYRIHNPRRRCVNTIFGVDVPIGPLDNAADLVVAVPGGVSRLATVLIEAKSRREWTYPQTGDVYQLLDKAAQLQITFPECSFVPVLVCRRPHLTLFHMAKTLGFLVFYTMTGREYLQPILPISEVNADHVQAVNDTLGYRLDRSDDPHWGLTTQFKKTLPRYALPVAEQWRHVGSQLASHYAYLRTGATDNEDSSSDDVPDLPGHIAAMQCLRLSTRRLLGVNALGW